MKALVATAEWAPKPSYKLTEHERTTRKVFKSNNVWKNPKVQIKEVPEPQVGPEDVLIKVKVCGICGSDLHTIETGEDGYMIYPAYRKMPVILGHEYSGVVEKVGDRVTDFQVGDMVVAEVLNWCGKCINCRSGYMNNCETPDEVGHTIDGAFAELIATNTKYCWKINQLAEVYEDKEEVFEVGALIEPISVNYNGMFVQAGGFFPGASVAIFGAGPIGLTAAILAKAAGAAKIILFEPVEDRLKLAKAMGVKHTFNPTELKKERLSPSNVVRDLTGGRGVEMCVECAGNARETATQMMESLATRGKIVWVGWAGEQVNVSFQPFIAGTKSLTGALASSERGAYRYIIDLLSAFRKQMNITKLIKGRCSLPDLPNVMENLIKTKPAGKMIAKI